MSAPRPRGRRRVPVDPQDGIWLQDSPRNRMIVNSLVTLDRMDLGTLRETWRQRILELDGGRRYPRFTWRVVRRLGRYYWEEDSEFDLDRHVVGVPDDRVDTREKLQRYIASEASKPLPADRPLWQIQHVERFEGGSAVFFRVHHCMGDGGALMPVLLSLMDEDPGRAAEGAATPPSDKWLPGPWLVAAATPVLAPWVVLQKMLWRADRSVLHGPPCSGEKAVAWSDPIDLDRLRHLKDHFGVTINDLLMACVAGAFRRYLEKRSPEPARRVRVTMPIDVRRPGEPFEMRNKFSPVLLELPIAAAEPGRSLAAVKERLDRMKGSLEPAIIHAVVTLMLKALPGAVSRGLLDFLANKCTCVATNVPGPRQTLHVAGRRLHGMMFWVPQRADIGIGLSILSFSGRVQIGVISDTRLLPDPGAYLEALQEELESFGREAGL